MNLKYHLIALHWLAICIGWVVIVGSLIAGIAMGCQWLVPHLPSWGPVAIWMAALALLIYSMVYMCAKEVDEANNPRLRDN